MTAEVIELISFASQSLQEPIRQLLKGKITINQFRIWMGRCTVPDGDRYLKQEEVATDGD